MKIALFLFCICFLAQSLNSQVITKADFKKLTKIEDSLKGFAKNMIQGREPNYRLRSDSFFIKCFIRALQIKNSFNYSFDSVIYISRLVAPDNSFKIFTWQLMISENKYVQRGAIQIKTENGSLKLIPLFDKSDFVPTPIDSVRDSRSWIGAVYYKIIQKEIMGKPAYLLFGFDNNNARSDKKWLDVLRFNDKGEPLFGAPIFQKYAPKMAKDFKFRPHRFCLEYKKDGRARLTYDEEKQIVAFDHLLSETGDDELQHTFIPSGDIQGFTWEDEKLWFVDQVFDQVTEIGKMPITETIYNKNGEIDEKKLAKQNEKNIKKEKEEEEKRNKNKPKPTPKQEEDY
jgi:hypothetical protein